MDYTRQVNKECMTPYITEPYSKKKANARFPNKPTISLKLWQHRLRHQPVQSVLCISYIFCIFALEINQLKVKGMKKAILLVRVSTDRQDFDEQEKQLYDLAVADGYKENEIIIIAEKESGIKLYEDERKGLNRLKEEIAKGDVKTVYVWEVSRIGRKKKVIFSVVDLLQSHNIQLIVKEPSIRLLNDDGSINDGAETILTLFAQMAESEMRNKQSRWKRTKQANAKVGKWNGGKLVKFGYILDANNYYIVNEEEAKIIREIYHLYLDETMSQRDIVNELKSRGIILTNDRVRRILQDKGYTGEEYITTVYRNNKREEGQIIKYPQIISSELFNAAKEKRAKANITVKRSEILYLGRQLIKCPDCGHSYIPYRLNKIYCCLAYKHDNHDIPKCHNNATININHLDSLLWYDAKGEYINYLNDARNNDKSQYINNIDILNQKITQCDKVISMASKKMEKIADMYVEGMYTKDKFNVEKEKIKVSTADAMNNKTRYTDEIEKINHLIESLDNEDVTDKYINSLATVDNIDNQKQMYDIAHRFISNVEIELTDTVTGYQKKNKRTKIRKVTVTHLDGVKLIYYINAWGDDVQYITQANEVVGMTVEEAMEKGLYFIDVTKDVQPIKHKIGRKR